MSEFRDVYSRITDKIIADLEQGVRPWMRPWNAEHAAGKITRPLRHNGIPYKGINVVMLWSASVTEGLRLPAVADLQAGARARRQCQEGRDAASLSSMPTASPAPRPTTRARRPSGKSPS